MNDVVSTSVIVGLICLVAGVIIGQVNNYRHTRKERSQFVEILETLQRTHNEEVARNSTAYEKALGVYDKAVKCYEKAKRRCEGQEGESKAEYGPGEPGDSVG